MAEHSVLEDVQPQRPDRRKLWLILGAVGLAVGAFLAFGVFGVQTLFYDNEVSEALPEFTNANATESESESTPSGNDSEEPSATETTETDSQEVAETEQSIITEFSGTFVDAPTHSASGTAVVLSDGGTQRFLRFEEDFVTDNGPDLNVYLATDESASDFIDLGDLTGNIGSQNYEIPADVDLGTYDTVLIWCVRFGVGFGSAELS